MRLLVVGATGLLGSNVTDIALGEIEQVVTTHYSSEPGFDCPSHHLDITSTMSVDMVVSDVDPDAIINCAAMTDVDGCETNPERANAVNAEGAENVAQAAEQDDADLIHTSTDYVFDGDRDSPYPEDADPNPCQEYGRSKLEGERLVHKVHSDPTILRLSFVYGRSFPDGTLSGFPAWVCNQAADGVEIPLFTDQCISPSYARTTAKTILDLLDSDHSGTFNVASNSCVTPFEFGSIILREAEFDETSVQTGSLDDMERNAKRPRYTCLDVTRIEETLDCPQPMLQEDVEDLF